MPREMFGSVVRPPAGSSAGSRVTVPLSLAAHAAALIALIVVPLVATDAMPSPRRLMTVMVGQPAVPPEPPPPPRAVDTPRPPAPDAHAAPVNAPQGVAPEPPRPPDAGLVDRAPVAGVIDGVGAIPARDEPPPPPPAPPAVVRVGGNVTAPTRIAYVAPVYPDIAVRARMEGVVIIQATIGVDGRVTSAQILRPSPLLEQAALDAVRQWRYTPTQLNGQPVEVIMTVTVSFVLGRE